MFEAVGCPRCSFTGFKGRSAIHEIMPVTPGVAKLISGHAPMESVCDEATRYGYGTMQQRAIDLVTQGITSLDEAKRVVFLDAAYVEAPTLRLAA